MGPPPPEPGAAASLRPGTVIAGRYRLENPIATGGMARVWTATDEVLGRPVAVKLLLEHFLSDESFVRRFRAEALAAARLTHPSVVSVYDTCSVAGIEAIVMELIDGTTLRQRLDDEGALSVTEACRIASRVADALSVAHQAQIVHRDIKPANVLLSTTGRVVVTDFGIAKASEVGDLTTESQMLGTAKYLAPEQVEGGPVDGRSDVYALGVVLYEMLTGRVPFRADTEAGTALARLHQDPPPPRQVRGDLPRELEQVVLRMLARDPHDRWPDAASLSRTLGAMATGRPRPPEPAIVGRAPAPAPPPPHPPPRPPDRPAPQAPPAPPAEAPRPRATDPPRRPARRAGPAMLLVALVALAILVAGALVWRVLGAGGTEEVRPAAAAFDPFGTGAEGESNGEAPLAVDGDPDTAWPTETYRDRDIAAQKDGVGLALDLGARRRTDTLAITSTSEGWDAVAYVFDELPQGPFSDWGEPVGGATDIAGDVRIDLGGAEGRIVLLWITRTSEEGLVEVAETTVEVQT